MALRLILMLPTKTGLAPAKVKRWYKIFLNVFVLYLTGNITPNKILFRRGAAKLEWHVTPHVSVRVSRLSQSPGEPLTSKRLGETQRDSEGDASVSPLALLSCLRLLWPSRSVSS